MKIVFSPQSRIDLREICNYVERVLCNPAAADKIAEQVITSAHRLVEQPLLGFSLQSKIGRETEHRCLISGNYGIIYRAFETKIRVFRILDMRTDYIRAVLDVADEDGDF